MNFNTNTPGVAPTNDRADTSRGITRSPLLSGREKRRGGKNKGKEKRAGKEEGEGVSILISRNQSGARAANFALTSLRPQRSSGWGFIDAGYAFLPSRPTFFLIKD